MPVQRTHQAGGSPVLAWSEDIEQAAVRQLLNTASLPFIHRHVAAMPDAHYGLGATVGSVLATKRAVVPAAVGVDIGCGMVATRLTLTANDLPDSLAGVRSAIEAAVPVGFSSHVDHHPRRRLVERLEPGYEEMAARLPKSARKDSKAGWRNQLGTLGGGNHFVEVCLDEQQRVWAMLHSGSRGVGNLMGSWHIERARKRMEAENIRLPDANLAYLEQDTAEYDNYVQAVQWCQDYAKANREALLDLTLKAMAKTLPPFRRDADAVNCHHNYISWERHYGEEVIVTRKGAIRARKGELGIIPGSMGAASYIVRGLGCAESFESCSHGAGRRMSRGEAKRTFSLDDLAAQTNGVECRKDKGVLDEAPGAYKDIDVVMANQVDLVEKLHQLRQVVCVKG